MDFLLGLGLGLELGLGLGLGGGISAARVGLANVACASRTIPQGGIGAAR